MQDDGEVVIELRMRKVRLLAFPNKTKFKQKKPWTFYVPKSNTCREFELKIKRLLGGYYLKKSRDQSIVIVKFRLWKCNTDDLEEI